MKKTNKEYNKSYYQKNKEKIKEQSKSYYQKNKQQYKENHKSYYQKNKEQIHQKHYQYVEKNSVIINEYRRNYKYLKQGKSAPPRRFSFYRDIIKKLQPGHEIFKHIFHLPLTDKQRKVVCLTSNGLSAKQIQKEMHHRQATFCFTWKSIYVKFVKAVKQSEKLQNLLKVNNLIWPNKV